MTSEVDGIAAQLGRDRKTTMLNVQVCLTYTSPATTRCSWTAQPCRTRLRPTSPTPSATTGPPTPPTGDRDGPHERGQTPRAASVDHRDTASARPFTHFEYRTGASTPRARNRAANSIARRQS
jgi:hypothetical protein